MSHNRYTPATIDKLFSIPLYQRLFEWDDAQVTQLLADLYAAFSKDSTAPYYIGMLTAYKDKDERYSLVDGQQRFTVLMLIGIVLDWDYFLKNGNGALRLNFFARKNDENYLKDLISGNLPTYINKKMSAAIECIFKFLDNIPNTRVAFSKYALEQTTFFISELPNDYNLQDLNRYFEAMNEAGKGLENHEILKVKLLKHVTAEKRHEYTCIWNIVSQMNRCLILPGEKEKEQDYKNKNLAAFLNPSIDAFSPNKNADITFSNGEEYLSILQISPNSKKPSESVREAGEQAILNFTDFILQVLWICLNEDNRINATEFFNRNKLLTTFDSYIKQLHQVKDCKEDPTACVDVDHFFKALLEYRLLFDYYVIRQNSKEQSSITYSLNHISENEEEGKKQSHIQYQSMLLVSTETQLWLTPFLDYLRSNKQTSISDSLSFLKTCDNERQNKSFVSLDYGSINRYWFWRLDYYLWLNRTKYFSDEKQRRIANNYIFRANRSIEHIAPQQPRSESRIVLDVDYLHKLGNLAMISSGQNSSLQNESFEVKKAHVQSFINDSIGGSIQSLKLLKIHEFGTWNEENLIKHHNDMVAILIESFENDENYTKIIEKLKQQILHPEPTIA